MCKHCQESKNPLKPLKEVIVKNFLNGEKTTLFYNFKTETLSREEGKPSSLPIDTYYKQKENTIKRLVYPEKLFFFQLDYNDNLIFPIIEDIRVNPNILRLEFSPICAECDEVIEGEKISMGKKFYCEACSDSFVFCSECDERIDKDEALHENGNCYCESCHNDKFFYCEHCSETREIENMVEFNGNYYCDSCINEVSVSCFECGCRVCQDESYYSERTEENYCESCFPSDNGQEFDSKRINLNNNTFKKITQNFRFGIELEIDEEDIEYNSIEENTCFGSKEDGSLSKGSEFYSPILQGDKGYNEIEKFCNCVKGLYASTSTGFHLHIGAEKFEIKDIKRIYLTYRIIEDYIFAILPKSRSNNRYCNKSLVEIDSIYKIENMDDLKNQFKN